MRMQGGKQGDVSRGLSGGAQATSSTLRIPHCMVGVTVTKVPGSSVPVAKHKLQT
jgi:hypothetical protein